MLGALDTAIPEQRFEGVVPAAIEDALAGEVDDAITIVDGIHPGTGLHRVALDDGAGLAPFLATELVGHADGGLRRIRRRGYARRLGRRLALRGLLVRGLARRPGLGSNLHRLTGWGRSLRRLSAWLRLLRIGARDAIPDRLPVVHADHHHDEIGLLGREDFLGALRPVEFLLGFRADQPAIGAMLADDAELGRLGKQILEAVSEPVGHRIAHDHHGLRGGLRFARRRRRLAGIDGLLGPLLLLAPPGQVRRRSLGLLSPPRPIEELGLGRRGDDQKWSSEEELRRDCERRTGEPPSHCSRLHLLPAGPEHPLGADGPSLDSDDAIRQQPQENVNFKVQRRIPLIRRGLSEITGAGARVTGRRRSRRGSAPHAPGSRGWRRASSRRAGRPARRH